MLDEKILRDLSSDNPSNDNSQLPNCTWHIIEIALNFYHRLVSFGLVKYLKRIWLPLDTTVGDIKN